MTQKNAVLIYFAWEPEITQGLLFVLIFGRGGVK